MIAFVISAALVAAAAPGTGLAPAQKRELAAAIVCPERLPDDQARIRSARSFYELYGRFRPGSHAGERMAYRDTLLHARKCSAQGDALIHTFPES
ncbi:hypothetical protein HL653_09725 [Sphingomonas sp. AP4-R1]|uniref:hypothetical protein n=1 Tax=Sphingomonas sp. AP4-R1 TaxID=2735134 RepID=UPI0014939282|nr:hypothetical protein [Sphingomonas sp. AP4-R1]QJU58041.1 hypothetical protein HL653_09725 [Sphingomonas sp. AP4-R1]